MMTLTRDDDERCDTDTQNRLKMTEVKEWCHQTDKRRRTDPMIMKEQGKRQTRVRRKKKCYRCGRDGYHIARFCDYTTDMYGVQLGRYTGRSLWRRQPWTDRRHGQIGQIARVAKQETPSVIRSICDTLLKFRPAAEQAGLTVRQYPGGYCNEYWGRKSKPRLKRRGKLCYRCRRPNHIARQCRFHIDVFGNSLYSRGTATTTAVRQQVKVETGAVGHPTEQVTEIERETETKNAIIENEKREVVNTQSKSMTTLPGVVTLGDTVSSRGKVDIIGQPTELEPETETIIKTENEIIENERLKRDFVTIQSKSMTPGVVALVDTVSSRVNVDIIGQPTELESMTETVTEAEHKKFENEKLKRERVTTQSKSVTPGAAALGDTVSSRVIVDIIGQPTELESETGTIIEQNAEKICEELRQLELQRYSLDRALRAPKVKYAVKKDLQRQIRRLEEEIKQKFDKYEICEGERRKTRDSRSCEQFTTNQAVTRENLKTKQTVQNMCKVALDQTVEDRVLKTDPKQTVDKKELEQTGEELGLKTEQTDQTELIMDKMEAEQTVEDLEQNTEQTGQTVPTMKNVQSEQTVEELKLKTGQIEQTEQTVENVKLKTEQIQLTDNINAEQGVNSADDEETVESFEAEQSVEDMELKTEQTEQTELITDKMEPVQTMEELKLKTDQTGQTDLTMNKVEAGQSVKDIGLKTEQTEQTKLKMDKMKSEQTIEELKTGQTDRTIGELELKTDQTVKTNQTDQTDQTELTVEKVEAVQRVDSVAAKTEQSLDNIGAEKSELTTDKMDPVQTMEVLMLKTVQNDLTMELELKTDQTDQTDQTDLTMDKVEAEQRDDSVTAEAEQRVDGVEDEQNADHVGTVEMEETTFMTNDAEKIVTRISSLDKKMAKLEKVEKDVKRAIQAASAIRFKDIDSLESLEHCRATVERLKAENEAERIRLQEDSYSTTPVYTIIVRPIAEKWNECARALKFKSKLFFDIHWRVITLRDQWNHKPMIEMEDSRLRVLRGLITDIDNKLYDDNDIHLSDHQTVERAEALTQLDDFIEQYIDHSNTVSGFKPLRECSRQSRRNSSYRTLVFHKEDLRIMELYEDNYWSAIQIICQTAENDGWTDPTQMIEHSWRCTAARKALEKHRETFRRQVVEEPVENGLECEKVAVVSTNAKEELEKKQKEEMGNVELYRRPYEELTVEEARALEDEFYARTYAEDRTGTKFEGRPWRAMYNGMTWSSFDKTRRNMLEPVSTKNEMNGEGESRSEATSENSAWGDKALWGDNACFTDYSSDEEEQ